MAATFFCRACNFQRAMSEADIGKRGRCPKCGAAAQVVAAAAAGTQSEALPQTKARRDQTVLGEPLAGEPLAEEAIQAAPRTVRPARDGQHAFRAPPPLPTFAEAAAPASPRWYYSYDDERIGPMSESALQARIDKGEVRAADLVWREGTKEWRRADDVFEFHHEPRRRRRRRRRDGDQSQGGLVCGIIACICGGVAFVFCPIVLGLAGIVLGIVSVSISENKTIGIVGIAISGVGMVVGMVLSFLLWSAMGFGPF